MEDKGLLDQINELAAEEHELFQKESRGEATEADVERLRHLEVTLDQCWDLLHQRRARRDAGLDPDVRTGQGVGVEQQPIMRCADGAALDLLLIKGEPLLVLLEPPEVAYPEKADVDAAYVRLIETSLHGGGYTAIATHDERLIEHAIAFTQSEGIARDRFEFQMLYGVRPQLQLDLAGRGFKVLVATPFGPEWFPYLMRRLAERPANLGFFVRNALRR